MPTLANDIIELHCEDRDGQIRVILPKGDRLAMSVTTAVEACRAYGEQQLFRTQFEMLLERLAQWLHTRRDGIKQAFLTVRDAGLLFLVIREQKQFSMGFENELTELDIAIANDSDFDLIQLSVLAIPPSAPETIESFLSDKLRLRYSKDGK